MVARVPSPLDANERTFDDGPVRIWTPPTTCPDGEHERRITPLGPDSELVMCWRCKTAVCVGCGSVEVPGALMECPSCTEGSRQEIEAWDRLEAERDGRLFFG